MSTGDGKQNASASGNCPSNDHLQPEPVVGADTRTAITYSAGFIFDEYELYGGGRSTVYSMFNGNCSYIGIKNGRIDFLLFFSLLVKLNYAHLPI